MRKQLGSRHQWPNIQTVIIETNSLILAPPPDPILQIAQWSFPELLLDPEIVPLVVQHPPTQH